MQASRRRTRSCSRWQAQIDSLIDSAQKLREALARKKACRAALGHVPLETLLPDIATLGADPSHALLRAPTAGV